jgi:hypothetical protein
LVWKAISSMTPMIWLTWSEEVSISVMADRLTDDPDRTLGVGAGAPPRVRPLRAGGGLRTVAVI